MRVKATIITTLKSALYGWKQTLLMFCIFPIILAVIMGNFQKEAYKPDINREKINITIIDEDNSKLSNSFKELFNSDSMKDIFNISNKGDYTVTIPKSYENKLLNYKEVSIKVDENKRISSSNELIITELVKQYGSKVTESIIISNKINLSNIKDKDKLYSNINEEITKTYEKSSFKTNILKGERVLSSMENQAATLITFMVFAIIMACIASHNLEKENGKFKRLVSTPMTKNYFLNLDILMFFISSFIFGGIYILSFSILGFAFSGINPINLLCILVCQSALIAAVSGFVVVFLGKKFANLIIFILMQFQILFGGGFIPINEVKTGIFSTLTHFAPGNLLSQAYKSCIITNSISNFSKELLLMLLIGGILYLMASIKVKVSWEE